MPNQNAIDALRLAAVSGDHTTITTWNGRELRGVPALHRTEPGLYRIKTGQRGRPPMVHEDDVETVDFS